MSFSKKDQAFNWLDEQPQAPEGLLVRTRQGETRCVPFPPPAEFGARILKRGQAEHRSRKAFGRLERAQNLLAILTHQLKKEECDEP